MEAIALATMERALVSSDLGHVIFMGQGPFFFFIMTLKIYK
ncbi:hypothetical protein [Selenomonas ruminantium]|nr:hypothetical protein [Selenomonas ruminantium]